MGGPHPAASTAHRPPGVRTKGSARTSKTESPRAKGTRGLPAVLLLLAHLVVAGVTGDGLGVVVGSFVTSPGLGDALPVPLIGAFCFGPIV